VIVDELIVRLDVDGRVVAACASGSAASLVPRLAASHRAARGGAMDVRGVGLDWSTLTVHGGGAGEITLLEPDGSERSLLVVVERDEDGWVATFRPLARAAREPGVIRDLPALLAAWRAAERALEASDGQSPALAGETRRLADLYAILSRAAAQRTAPDTQGTDAVYPAGRPSSGTMVER
jgi:hypothetical protein